MTETNQNKLMKVLLTLVLLLIVIVGIQAWHMQGVKEQLNTIHEHGQKTVATHNDNQVTRVDTGKPQPSSENKDDIVAAIDNTAIADPLPQAQTPSGRQQPPARQQWQNPGQYRAPAYPQPYPQPWQLPQNNRPSLFDDDFFNTPYDAQNWNPYEEIQRMQRDMDRIFNNAFNRFDNSPDFQHLFREGVITPEMDVKEDDRQYTVIVNLPGTDKNNVSVNLDGQQLTIKGEQKYEQEDKDAMGNIVYRERRSGSFQRSITLPQPVKQSGMKTDIKNGVLTITIPKA